MIDKRSAAAYPYVASVSEHHTRVVNLNDRHQTVQDIQVALRKIQDSFADHCHSCPRTDYLLKCQGNETKTCEGWICPDHNEGTWVQPRCRGPLHAAVCHDYCVTLHSKLICIPLPSGVGSNCVICLSASRQDWSSVGKLDGSVTAPL